MKFGGTSVGSAERIRALAELVRRLPRPRRWWWSPPSRGSPTCWCAGQLALARDAACARVLAATLARHREAVEALVPPGAERDQLLAHVENVLAELRALYSGTAATRCPGNPLGIKGCGEAGAIAAPAAVINAITDAIGTENLTMPATAQTVWSALQKTG